MQLKVVRVGHDSSLINYLKYDLRYIVFLLLFTTTQIPHQITANFPIHTNINTLTAYMHQAEDVYLCAITRKAIHTHTRGTLEVVIFKRGR